MNKDVKILKKYNQPVIEALKKLREKRRVSKICREHFNGMNPSRITEIIRGERDLTPYYLKKFINAGIVDLKEIFEGKKFSDIPKEDHILFKRLNIRDETLFLISQIENSGINLDLLLKEKLESL